MKNLEKKSNITNVLNDLNFNDKEKEVFLTSIQITRHAQNDDSINSNFEIDKLIKEMIKNEI